MKSDEYWKILENRQLFYQQKIPSLIGFESAAKLDEAGELIWTKIGEEGSILEIGSGNNALQKKLQFAGHKGVYHTRTSKLVTHIIFIRWMKSNEAMTSFLC